MGIYIKGLNLPKEGCTKIILCADGTVWGYSERPNNYDAIQLQPHGRLIDADALDTSVLRAGFSYAITRRKLRYTPGEVRGKIQNAPTIIPAEEE